jgi:hypothetical protein
LATAEQKERANSAVLADNVAPEVPMRSISLYVLVSCLCWSCIAQDSQKPSETPEQGLEKLLGRKIEPVSNGVLLKECQGKLQQWEDWRKVNIPLCQQWHDDNALLLKQNDELQEEANTKRNDWFLLVAGAFGFGVGMAYLLYRGIKKIWPPSSQHKQLAVLVVGAVWVAGAALYAIVSSPRASASMTELRAMVYSLPGVLFGGIGFWWFGRRIVVRLF